MAQARKLLPLLILVASLAPAAAAQAYQPLAWSTPTLVDDVPSHGGQPYEMALSCPATDLCVAGDSFGRILTTTDAPSGDWKQVAAVKPSGSAEAFNDISCPSKTLCVAADNRGEVVTSTDPTGPGSAWHATDVDGTTSITGVSCTSHSALLCVAVDNSGNVLTSTDPTGGAGAWMTTSAVSSAGFTAISCASTALCVATAGSGDLVTSTDPSAASPTWTSAAHSTATYPAYIPQRIACTDNPTLLCVMVDAGGVAWSSTNPAGGGPTWNGVLLLPDGSAVNQLPSVACPTSQLCVVGDEGGHVFSSTTPTGDAAAWSASTADPGYNEVDQISYTPYIYALSCPSTSLCVGVDEGHAMSTSTPASGGWSLQWNDAVDEFQAMTCTSQPLCVAVDDWGNVATSTTPDSTPSHWKVVDADTRWVGPNPLVDVSCTTNPSLLCVAVDGAGNVISSTNPTGDANAWNTVQDLGPAGSSEYQFTGISCPSTTLCVATERGGNAVTTHDPGSSSWTAAQIDTGAHDLTGVACPSTTFCVAVDLAGNVMTSTDPAGGAGAWTSKMIDAGHITSITCPTTSFCLITDRDDRILTSTNPAGDASAWTQQVADGRYEVWMDKATCPSASFCMATDNADSVYVSDNPTGGRAAWTESKPDGLTLGGTLGALNAIGCVSSSLCLVGDDAGNVVTGTPNPTPFQLSLAVIGNGSVTDGNGFSCSLPNDGSDYYFCANDYARDAPLTLTATPAAGYVFDSWAGGPCDGSTNPVCMVTMATDRNIDAYFNAVAAPADTTAPMISLTTPADGAHYAQGATVHANYGCTDEQGGSGVASCVGSVANGAAIDTAGTGAHSFAVTAHDVAGNASTVSVSYTVDPPVTGGGSGGSSGGSGSGSGGTSTAPTTATDTTGTTGVTGTNPAASLSPSQIGFTVDQATLSALQALAAPTGTAGSASAVEKAGGFTGSVPGPGSISDLVSTGTAIGSRDARAAAKPVVVARFNRTFTTPGPHKFVVKLTPAGRKMLRHGKGLKLASKVVFTPAGGQRVTVTKTFKLRK